MLPDRVSNPGPLTYESSALPTALRGPAGSSTAVIILFSTGVQLNTVSQSTAIKRWLYFTELSRNTSTLLIASYNIHIANGSS